MVHIGCSIPGVKYQEFHTGSFIPDVKCRISGTEYQVPDITYQAWHVRFTGVYRQVRSIMLYPFLVADSRSHTKYRLSDSILAKLSLAPVPPEWNPEQVMLDDPDPVWAESIATAPSETIPAISEALEDLILATNDLRVPDLEMLGDLPDGRARRHLTALIGLWGRMGDALPEGLGPVRHMLEIRNGRCLAQLPVVEGTLDPHAPAAFRALHHRLKREFGTEPGFDTQVIAPLGSRLRAIQGGIAAPEITAGPGDDSLAFHGLRDPEICAEFAAAQAGAFMKIGVAPGDIAVMTGGDSGRLSRAFAAQGVPFAGHPDEIPKRDVIGETALYLLMAKRGTTPAMALAALALSPLMPWEPKSGHELAESLMQDDFRGDPVLQDPAHIELWKDIQSGTGSREKLCQMLDEICDRLEQGSEIRARISIPPGDGQPDWDMLFSSIRVEPGTMSGVRPDPNGVRLWSAGDAPWRSCKHLIVSDFTDGLYPDRPVGNPMFLENEIAVIRKTTGLHLHGRAERLEQGLSVFDRQLGSVLKSATFLVPWRDMAGLRLQPSVGLSLIARAFEEIDDATDLIEDLSALPPESWPIGYHRVSLVPELPELPEALLFPDIDLLKLRRKEDGTVRPQTPSRMESLLVSPLAWLLDEIGVRDMSWAEERIDIRQNGSIAHEVFENIFPKNRPIPDVDVLKENLPGIYEKAVERYAPFLRGSAWELERNGLRREIEQAVLRWREHMLALGAKVIGNEIWLAGVVNSIHLQGKVDAILELSNGDILVVDHKKSGTTGRRKRMAAGWDLQAGLYRDMMANPVPGRKDMSETLAGRNVGIAYNLMNDGGVLVSGLSLPASSQALDMGDHVNVIAEEQLTIRAWELAEGRIVLNTTEDEDFFEKEAGFTPYALTRGPALVTTSLREPDEEGPAP